MTRVTIIVSLWLVMVGTIADTVGTPSSPHGPLQLLGLYALVTALAVGAVWLHLTPDEADAAPPRREPFRWD